MPVKSVKIESVPARAALAAALLLSVAGAYFFAKWCVANTISTRTDYREVADFAVRLAPDDPQTHYASGVLHEKSFLPEDFSKSLEEFEKAAALSPHNYLLWLALAKARERSGDAEGAEKAARRASALAPAYAQVQWTLGNILLRRGKREEAFAEIRKAVAADPKLTDAAVSTAWQIFAGDIGAIRQAVGDSAQIKAALTVFLARQNRFDEAFEFWNSLAPDEKRTDFRASGEEFYNQLLAARKFRLALQIYAQTAAADAPIPSIGEIGNGGFENEIKMQKAGAFEWQIAEGAQPQIALSDQKRGGVRSLLMIFNSADGRDFRAVAQTAAVEAGKTYEFQAFYKSDLKTAKTFRWEIADAADGRVLAATNALAPAVPEWTPLKAKFSVPAATEAVVVRLVRTECGGAICPIAGRIWFDDLELN